MIVGRDTENLDEPGVTRAAVETVAESTADGVIAPMLYMLFGGAALGCLYKAVNTMDSMVGYRNERYLYFGRAGARLDDVFGYLPARMAAMLIIASAAFLRQNARQAYRIWRRDRRNHASPNSGHTEAACAGALGVRLAGPAAYSGVPRLKPYIGDGLRPIVPEDIKIANRLLYMSAALMLALAVIARGVLYAVL
jgi:adenosylcobinamide-phosphate synthase